jgi:predicted nucleotide-binding protein
MNWIEVFNKLFKLINAGENYFSGPRFITLLQETKSDFPNYGDYLEGRGNEGKSTTRQDYFKDIFLSLRDSQKVDFAKRIIKETYAHDLAQAKELDSMLGGASPIPTDFVDQPKDDLNEFSKLFDLRLPVQQTKNMPIVKKAVDSRTVFVVHGRNSTARKSLFQFLRSIGLHPLEWTQVIERTGKAAPYVGEILETGFAIAQAAVVLFTPDDEAKLREEFWGEKEPSYETELTGQARLNVLFEAGMAMGLYPNRTVLIEMGELRPVSDIGGRHTIRMNNSIARRQELAQRLKTAGCAVNLIGSDWHEDGDFEITFLPKRPAPVLRKKIPEKTKHLEPIDVRLSRILKIKKIEREFFGKIVLPPQDDGLIISFEVPARQGDLEFFVQGNEINPKGFYISNPMDYEGNSTMKFEKQLADIRVLLEDNCQRSEVSFTFVLVSDQDESINRPRLISAFEKAKTFMNGFPENFSLEIWDIKEISRQEGELGIKVDF